MIADVRFEPFEGGILARLVGDVDMSNADDIGRAVKQVMGNEALGLVLELSDVDYFDSAGIHMLYDVRESLRVRGQRLWLVVPESSPARDALRLAAVLQTLDVVTGVDEATAGVVGA